jgi:hypothetical protein
MTIETARAKVKAALAKCETAVTNSQFEAAVDEAKIALAYLDLMLRESKRKSNN